MSKLKDLVPPLELCRKIPVGKFEDSALVLIFWHKSPNTPVEIRTRCEVENDPEFDDLVEDQRIIIYPAPTLAEIMEADHRIRIACSCDDKTWLANCWVNGTWTVRNDINPTTAAMKLWLAGNGVEVKDE